MGIDKGSWNREQADRPREDVEKVEELQAEQGDDHRPKTWVDPRTWLTPEERKLYYGRVHAPLTEDELADLEAQNPERDDVPSGWNKPGQDLDRFEADTGNPESPSSKAVQGDNLPETQPDRDERVRLRDPVKDGPWSAERGEVRSQSVRMGDQIVNEETDSRSRLERMRQGVWEKVDDSTQVAEEIGQTLDQFRLDNQPTHVRAETRADVPTYDVPNQTMDGGSAAVGLYAIGLVTGELVKKAHEVLKARRSDTDAGDR